MAMVEVWWSSKNKWCFSWSSCNFVGGASLHEIFNLTWMWISVLIYFWKKINYIMIFIFWASQYTKAICNQRKFEWHRTHFFNLVKEIFVWNAFPKSRPIQTTPNEDRSKICEDKIFTQNTVTSKSYFNYKEQKNPS